MTVSRKNRSMKKTSKSSKRSKNARTSKKTRKYMRKHRGGKSVNRYILYDGNLDINKLNVGTKFYIKKKDENYYREILTIISIEAGNNDNGRTFTFRENTEDEDLVEAYERGNHNVNSILNIYANENKDGNDHNLYYVL